MTSNDVFLGGGSSSGSLINAELPNVIGSIYFCGSDYGATGGVGGYPSSNNPFYYPNVGEGGTGFANVGTRTGTRISIDLSRYTSIYKNNNKLIPKHYVIEFWIKYK